VRAELEERLVAAAAKLRVGDPTDPSTDVGPLISAADQARVHEWVARAIARGGKLRLGGKTLPNQCHEVTVVADPPEDSELVAREVFGPVVSVMEYENEGDAVRRVNATRDPFQSAIFTQDVDRAFRLARAIDANAVIVNDHSAVRVDWMPFGGRDRAGYGLGGVPDACREMSRPKLVVVNVNE
jgi:acyl-CoA reductase-like NAD-dependent aldehyde dehydrogenase